MGKEQSSSPELLFCFLSLCEANTCQEQVNVYHGRSIFPRRKKVKSLVYFPTILNFRISGDMYIYSIMSTIINIVTISSIASRFSLLEAQDPSDGGGGVCPVTVTELYECWRSGFLCIC